MITYEVYVFLQLLVYYIYVICMPFCTFDSILIVILIENVEDYWIFDVFFYDIVYFVL